MTNDLVTVKNFPTFPPEDIKRAGQLLGCPLDEASAIKALQIQKDTGLSIIRGDINIVKFGANPTVMITRQGYLAYANKQPDYLGYKSKVYFDNGVEDVVAECEVHRKDRLPTTVKIQMKEFKKTYGLWREKPTYMLEKTAISLALREAFPILPDDPADEPTSNAAVKIEKSSDDIEVVTDL